VGGQGECEFKIGEGREGLMDWETKGLGDWGTGGLRDWGTKGLGDFG